MGWAPKQEALEEVMTWSYLLKTLAPTESEKAEWVINLFANEIESPEKMLEALSAAVRICEYKDEDEVIKEIEAWYSIWTDDDISEEAEQTEAKVLQ